MNFTKTLAFLVTFLCPSLALSFIEISGTLDPQIDLSVRSQFVSTHPACNNWNGNPKEKVYKHPVKSSDSADFRFHVRTQRLVFPYWCLFKYNWTIITPNVAVQENLIFDYYFLNPIILLDDPDKPSLEQAKRLSCRLEETRSSRWIRRIEQYCAFELKDGSTTRSLSITPNQRQKLENLKVRFQPIQRNPVDPTRLALTYKVDDAEIKIYQNRFGFPYDNAPFVIKGKYSKSGWTEGRYDTYLWSKDKYNGESHLRYRWMVGKPNEPRLSGVLITNSTKERIRYYLGRSEMYPADASDPVECTEITHPDYNSAIMKTHYDSNERVLARDVYCFRR